MLISIQSHFRRRTKNAYYIIKSVQRTRSSNLIPTSRRCSPFSRHRVTNRTWKLKNYRAHPTIEEYVLADSQSLKREISHKEKNKWIYEAFEKNEDITLNSLGVHFSLTNASMDVEFEDTLEDFESKNESGPAWARTRTFPTTRNEREPWLTLLPVPLVELPIMGLPSVPARTNTVIQIDLDYSIFVFRGKKLCICKSKDADPQIGAPWEFSYS